MFEMDFFVFGIASVREEVRQLLYVPEFIIKRCTIVSIRHPLSLKAFKERFPGYADKAFLVPHYLPFLEPLEEYRILEKFKGFGKPVVRLLFVGNLSRLKGLPELLKAYSIVKKDFPNLEFVVVSDFRDGPVAIPPEVKVLTNLHQTEVYRLMEETHIFAMPTKMEAIGRVFWEAMAKGCAILLPDVSPQRELFGEYGAVADPTSPYAIAEALLWMLQNPEECQRRALAGRQEFVEKYHHSIVERTYLQLFQEALRRGPAI